MILFGHQHSVGTCLIDQAIPMYVPCQPATKLNRCSRNVYVPLPGAVNSHDSQAFWTLSELQMKALVGLNTLRSMSAPSTFGPPPPADWESQAIATLTRCPAERPTGWSRLPLASKSAGVNRVQPGLWHSSMNRPAR